MATRLALGAAIALALVACGQPGSPAAPTPTGQLDGTASPPPTTPRSPIATVGATLPPEGPLREMTELALADLATRLRVAPEAIEIVRAEQVTWPDGSLGCPRPGMVYTQALVDGYRVILRHDGRIYRYHAGSDAEPFMCESDAPDGGYDFVPPPGFDE